MARRSLLRRPGVLLVAVLTGLLVAGVIDVSRAGGLDTWLARHGIAPAYDARGQLVRVEGGDVYLDCRGSGAPTVLLEAGFGSGAGSWGAALDGIAGFTRVCAWDRPGIGRSSSRGLHTPADTTRYLLTALGSIGERGPFVVVAHSLGGVYARIHGAHPPIVENPELAAISVLGYVMIDTYEPDLGVADSPLVPPEAQARLRAEAARDQTPAIIQAGEQLDWAQALEQLERSGTVSQPTLFLGIEPRLRYGDPDPLIRDALIEAWYQQIAARYPAGEIEIVPNTGHVIHLERPNLVIEGVRRFVLALRAG